MESITEKVISIINKCMKERDEKFQPIGSRDSNAELFGLGIDSIGFIRIVVELEKQFNIEFPDDKLLVSEIGTVNKIVSVLLQVLNNDEKG